MSTSPSCSRTTLFLILISFFSAIPMFYLGEKSFIGYDGYWHVFIAKHGWSDFFDEIQATAHPPLFFLLLRAAMVLGDGRLVYRIVSILSEIGAVFVIGQIARKITGSVGAAALAAFVFGLSRSAIEMSSEVRSYTLCVFFVLLSFYYYLDIVRLETGRSSLQARVAFSAFFCLAILSHYSAAFFFAACLAAPFCVAALNASYRSRLFVFLRAEWLPNLLTVAPLGALGVPLYLYQGRTFANPLEYIARFYFNPAGAESRTAFLLRNLHNLLELFSPTLTGRAAQFAPALLGVTIAAAIVVYLIRTRASSRNVLANITIAIFLVMLGGFMVASLRRRYPFGGGLRHQFLLFPFLVLSGISLFDRLATLLPTRHLQTTALALGFLAAAANGITGYVTFHIFPDESATADVDLFRALFPHPQAILIDQFNTILFFTHYHEWKWQRISIDEGLYRYSVTENGVGFTVFRDRSTWDFDYTQPRLYGKISQALATGAARSITVFCTAQCVPDPPHTPEQERLLDEKSRTLASQSGLTSQRLFIRGARIYGAFVPAKPSGR